MLSQTQKEQRTKKQRAMEYEHSQLRKNSRTTSGVLTFQMKYQGNNYIVILGQ